MAPRTYGSLVLQPFPYTEPVLRAGPSVRLLSLGRSFLQVAKCSTFPPLAPLPWHTPADLSPTPNTAVKCGGIRDTGGSREVQRGAGAQRAEASRNRGATGTSGLIRDKRHNRPNTPSLPHLSLSSPPASVTQDKAHDSELAKTWVQVTAGPCTVPVEVPG